MTLSILVLVLVPFFIVYNIFALPTLRAAGSNSISLFLQPLLKDILFYSILNLRALVNQLSLPLVNPGRRL